VHRCSFKALQTFIEDTTPTERAENFKDSGNIAFKIGEKSANQLQLPYGHVFSIVFSAFRMV